MDIIIVEDEENIEEEIKKVIRKFSIKEDINVKIKYYKRYNKELEKEIKDNTKKKIYLLDIELKNSISGIEIAGKIREEEWESEIIFITSHDYLFEKVHRELYEVFDFIEKFLDLEKRLEEDLEIIYKKKHDHKVLKIKSRNVDLEISQKSITHIIREKEERKTTIYTDKNEYKVNKNLKELQEELDQRFIKVHRSCLVNKQRVGEYNYAKGYVILDTGRKVEYLSKHYRKEIEKEGC